MLWKMRDAQGGDAFCDQTHAKNIEKREEVRQELLNKHLEGPALAVSDALRRAEEWTGAGSSGLRNGCSFHAVSHQRWAATVERDVMGDGTGTTRWCEHV